MQAIPAMRLHGEARSNPARSIRSTIRSTIRACSRPDTVALAVSIVVGVVAYGGIAVTNADRIVATVWISNAVLVAAVLRTGPARRRRIYAWSFLAYVVANVMSHRPADLCVLLPAANMLEVAVAVTYVRRLVPGAVDVADLRTLRKFMVSAGAFAPAASATMAAAAFAPHGAPFAILWMRWFLAHGLGALVFGAPLLALPVRGVRPTFVLRFRMREFRAFVLVVAITLAAFAQTRFPLLYVVLAALIFAAFQLTFAGTALAVMTASFIAVAATVAGHGPTALVTIGALPVRIFTLQTFLAVAVATVLPIAAALQQREALLADGRRRESEGEAFSARLRALQRIANDASETYDQQIRAALEHCRGALGFDAAYLATIDVATQSFVFTHISGVIAGLDVDATAGARRPLGDLLAWRTLAPHVGDDDFTVVDALQAMRPEEDARYAFIGTYLALMLRLPDGGHGCVGLLRGASDAAPITDLDREFVHLTGTLIATACDRRAGRERLRTLAFTDPVTGLANRTAFEARFESLVTRARTGAAPLAIVCLDLDGFKIVNDRYGHAAGDMVLEAAGARIVGVVRTTDVVARIGGDEFVVLLPDVASADAAIAVARTVVAALAEPFALGAGSHAVTASAGVAVAACGAGDERGPEVLLRAADAALYRAKAAGKNRVELAAQ